MKNIILVFAAVSAAILMGANRQSGECDELRKENEKLKSQLEESRKMTNAANMEARRQAKIAEEMRLAADKAQQEVEKAAALARENYQRAEAMLAESIRQAELARKNAEEVVRKKKLAEDSVKKKN